MTQDEIIEMAIQGHASTRDAIRWAMNQEREACAELKNSLHPMNFGGKQTYTAQELLDQMKQGILDYSDAIRARGQA